MNRSLAILLSALILPSIACGVTPTVIVVTATPAAVVTSTPLPVVSPSPTASVATSEPAMIVTVQLETIHGGMPFELRYDPAVWNFFPDPPETFVHRTISSCSFTQGGGRGLSPGPVEKERRLIAGREFTVSTYPADGLAIFTLRIPEGYYEFHVNAVDETLTRCREETARMLESFRLIAR
ncbi:MAG: hypothetical protein NZL91_05400 [Thermoflexales bacterium]|nr:hypothetical protein [Thermoflexales bacterium]MCS7324837.1 hypothetical protein [Thermoflexales bacterium]MDW8054930.1 hypothetical protein [Anaerolineae bacterium]MDW8396397.1 hypothetical protein [Anaerolineae bacterium]